MLQGFLFNASRASTGKINAQLSELQNEKCFYCGKVFSLAAKNKPEVDHFIPWARYPNDALTNFVVAHNHCNGAKRDFLAYEEHLSAWYARISDPKLLGELEDIASQNSWELVLSVSKNAGRAIYLNLQDEVDLWKEKQIFTPLQKSELSKILVQ